MDQLDWNDRYSDEEFVYGMEPNEFLVEHVSMLIGPVLSLAEGEGRNAVFLAMRGFNVRGVDGSDVGLAKRNRWPVQGAHKFKLKWLTWRCLNLQHALTGL